MSTSSRLTLVAVLGAACIGLGAAPASAGTLSIAKPKDVALNAPMTDVAYRVKHVRSARGARHVKVRRHYAAPRRYYYRRHYSNAVPAAAFGLFAGALGAALTSNYYDDCWYGYCDYGWGGYPAYYSSYGYGSPYIYRGGYGYARPYYWGGRRWGGHWGGRRWGGHWGGPRVAHFGGQRFVGGGHFAGPRVGGFGGRVGGFGGHGGAMRVGGGGHRR